MASFVDLIKVIFQVDSNQAKQGLAGVEAASTQAQGSIGKLKSGIGGFASQIKTGLGDPMTQAVIGVTGTVVALASKAIGAFQDTALAAGKLADATGLSTQEAGRLLEVFDDVGVSGESVQSGLNKMNKAIGSNRDEFAKLGLIGKTTGETFINVVNYLHNIPDPADRAAAATKLLGKGWTDMSEVIAAGGDQLTEAMDNVSAHKAVTPEQVEEARKFRDEMDSLSDTVDELELTLGEALVPTLTETASTISDVVGPVNDLTKHLGGLGGAVKFVNDWVNPITAPLHKIGDGISAIKGLFGDDEPEQKQSAASKEVADRYNDMAKAAKDAAGGTGDLGYAEEQATRAKEEAAEASKKEAAAVKVVTDQYHAQQEALKEQAGARRSLADLNRDVIQEQRDLTAAIKDSTGHLGKNTEANDKAQDAAIKLADDLQKQAEAQATASGATLTSQQSQKVWNDAMLTSTATMKGPLKTQMEAYIATVNGVPKEKVTEFNALVDAGKLGQAQFLLDDLAKERTATIVPTLNQYWLDKQLQELQRKIDTIERNSRPGTAAGSGSAMPTVAAAGVTNINIRTGTAGSDRAVAREVRRQLNLDRFSA